MIVEASVSVGYFAVAIFTAHYSFETDANKPGYYDVTDPPYVFTGLFWPLVLIGILPIKLAKYMAHRPKKRVAEMCAQANPEELAEVEEFLRRRAG